MVHVKSISGRVEVSCISTNMAKEASSMIGKIMFFICLLSILDGTAAIAYVELSPDEGLVIKGGCPVHCCRWLQCSRIPCDYTSDCPYIPGEGSSFCDSAASLKWCSLNRCDPAREPCCAWCRNNGVYYWQCGEYYEGPQECVDGYCTGGTATGLPCDGMQDCTSG